MIDVLVIGGGQSGLATAYALRRAGLVPVVVEASGQAAGSWPRYYDSLTLFSPARYSALPGLAFGGDPDRYPHRDEVVDYLLRYAAWLDADIRTGRRVTDVRADGPAFAVRFDDGEELAVRAVVAATGGFSRPYRPDLPGLDSFARTVLHAADYRNPQPYAGKRVMIVGAGNSAVQIAAELAACARVTLATRRPVRFVRQRPFGRDVHFWFKVTGVDALPVGRWLKAPPTVPVFDDGRYRAALAAGSPDRRPVFTRIDGKTITWADGTAEDADVILLATGYQPDLGYLVPLGALDKFGHARHRGGISTAHPRLGYVGLEWQTSLASASLCGVGRDAVRVAARLRAHLQSHPSPSRASEPKGASS